MKIYLLELKTIRSPPLVYKISFGQIKVIPNPMRTTCQFLKLCLSTELHFSEKQLILCKWFCENRQEKEVTELRYGLSNPPLEVVLTWNLLL